MLNFHPFASFSILFSCVNISLIPFSLQSPLSEEKIVHLLHGIACALQCLHAKRILHRDLKPENILITYEDKHNRGSKLDDPVVKIADFGFARHLNQSMAETFCGSPLYMAPEVLNGDSYDARADLWSVGTILYHMMTNGPPFKADSIKKLQQKLVNRPKLHYPHRYSEELQAMAESLLKVDPDARITFAQFFGHPLFRGWPELATKASGVPYVSTNPPKRCAHEGVRPGVRQAGGVLGWDHWCMFALPLTFLSSVDMLVDMRSIFNIHSS